MKTWHFLNSGYANLDWVLICWKWVSYKYLSVHETSMRLMGGSFIFDKIVYSKHKISLVLLNAPRIGEV